MEIKISIEYPRPLTVLVLLGVVVAFMWSKGAAEERAHADSTSETTIFYRNGEAMPQGGPDSRQGPKEYVSRLRLEQKVLTRKTDILRQQMGVLERAAGMRYTSEIRDAKKRLVALFYDERALEAGLLASLRELEQSRDRAHDVETSVVPQKNKSIAFLWPVEPTYGISAGFDDAAYEERFGFAHHAIDIPVEQGSLVYAAADGVVTEVSDRGFGFNALTIAHNGGKLTLYGHVRDFLVMEGQKVTAGDPIARSGGMPGTLGAGMLSTGPHLHFEVIAGGEPIDPLVLLPERLFGPTWVRVPMEFRARPGFSA